MKFRLRTIPLDVHSLIWLMLDYEHIEKLRNAVPELSNAISADKQLQANIFSRFVKQRHAPVPYNLRPIHTVNAHDIESWVRHVVSLDREYRSQDKELTIRKLDTLRDHRITWLKLVLGKWCLIAASNEMNSELSLWDMNPTSSPRFVTQIYLEAPVMDGVMDYSKGEIRCAITVGATHPYILVIGIYSSTSNVSFQQLMRICNASHVQYFRDDIVGFAVRDGDDTYPYLAIVKTGEMRCMQFPNNTPQLNTNLPIEPCIAITMLNGIVYTLHRTAIHIFVPSAQFDDDTLNHLRCLSALPLRDHAVSGEFLNDVGVKFGTPAAIHIVYQDSRSCLRQAVVRFDTVSRSFSLEDSLLEPIFKPPRFIFLYGTGYSGRILFCATLRGRKAKWDPVLHFARLRASSSSGSIEIVGSYIRIAKTDQPLLHLLSCVDFDDGNGLLLMGTHNGDVRIASVLSESVLTPTSTDCDIPRNFHIEEHPTTISEIRPVLDIPLFYSIRRTYRIYDKLPDEITRRITSRWIDFRLNNLSLADWSNNWLKFDRIWDWIFPLSRWGPLDEDFVKVNVFDGLYIRHRFQFLGDVIPVLFGVHNHREVVFRVGQRLFYSRRMRDDEDANGLDDFLMHSLGLFGVLPLTYDQYVNQPSSILPSLRNPIIITNISWYFGPICNDWRVDMAHGAHRVIQHLKLKGIDTSSMESWSDEEWGNCAPFM
ncbi:hypothetical protein ACEPAG_4666 [Sanghuangporus baumii]